MILENSLKITRALRQVQFERIFNITRSLTRSFVRSLICNMTEKELTLTQSALSQSCSGNTTYFFTASRLYRANMPTCFMATSTARRKRKRLTACDSQVQSEGWILQLFTPCPALTFILKLLVIKINLTALYCCIVYLFKRNLAFSFKVIR